MRFHPLLIISILGGSIPFSDASEIEAFEDGIDPVSSSSTSVRRRDASRALQGAVDGGGDCPDGDSLQINIKFDSYPEDFQMELKNDATKFAVWSRGDADRKFGEADQQSTAAASACLPSGNCWRLTIFDTQGDGLTFNSLPTGIGGGFRILFNGNTIDYYTGQFNGCFSTKWYRFGDACGGPGFVEYGYTLAPGCEDFTWDFSPTGILPGDLMDPSTPTDPTKPPPDTVPPAPAPSTAPSVSPTDAPTETPVAALTPAPTPAATAPPVPAPTNAPTTGVPVPLPATAAPTVPTSNATNYTQAGGGECTTFTFRATIAADPMEISYTLERAGDNGTIWWVQRPFDEGNDAPGTSVVNSACLDLKGCYTFTIRNKAYSPAQGPQRGSYTLRLGGAILAQFHGMKDGCYRKKWYQFGENCEFMTATEPVGARRCGEK